MKRTVRLLVAGMLVAVLPLGGASAADKSGTVAAGAPFTWDGIVATGTAFQNFVGGTGPIPPLQCSKDPTAYCETVLVGFDLTLTEAEKLAGFTKKRVNGEISIGSPTVPLYDFDLIIYDSDANGTKGTQLGTSGALDETPGEESYTISGATGTIANPIKYYLVEVVYFTSVQGNYKGTAKMTSTPKAS